jgi:hypothetical protein
MTAWQIILSSIGGSAVLFGALAWLFKSIINHYLSKDIDKFKANLQLEAQKEMAQIQSILGIEAFEHQIRFSRLHERRADIISLIYSSIVELHLSVNDFVRLLPSSSTEQNNSNLKRIWNAADQLKSSFEKNRIFFSDQICEKVSALNETMSKPVSEIVIHLEFDKEQNWEWLRKRYNEALDVLESKVPLIKAGLESDFRELLGVMTPSTKR